MIHVECSGPAREWRGRSRCARTVSCGVCVTVRAPWSVAGSGWVLEEQHSSQLEVTLRRFFGFTLHQKSENRLKSLFRDQN